MAIRGTVIGTGRSYPDGVEKTQVWLPKEVAAALRYQEGGRVVVTLMIGRDGYSAHLRAPAADPEHLYIGPDLYDYQGKRRRLADVLAGFGVNEPVDLEVSDAAIRLRKALP